MRLNNLVDIKVFVLYLMKNVGEPLEFSTVNDIVLQDEFGGYFDFAIAFSDLLELGQIEQLEGSDPVMYVISESGKETLENYEGSLLTVIKERALRSALRLMAFNRNGSRVRSEVIEEKGGFTVRSSIIDNEKTLFGIDVFVSERSFAEKLKQNFEDRAEIMYRGALSLLSGDVNFIFDD